MKKALLFVLMLFTVGCAGPSVYYPYPITQPKYHHDFEPDYFRYSYDVGVPGTGRLVVRDGFVRTTPNTYRHCK